MGASLLALAKFRYGKHSVRYFSYHTYGVNFLKKLETVSHL